MTAEHDTPADRESVTEESARETMSFGPTDRDRRKVALQQIVKPQIEVASDQVKDAWQTTDDPAEAAEQLRQAQANVGLLADLLDSLAAEDTDE